MVGRWSLSLPSLAGLLKLENHSAAMWCSPQQSGPDAQATSSGAGDYLAPGRGVLQASWSRMAL